MVNQIAIASGMVGVCEALLYAYKTGLDVPRVIDTISSGAAVSFSLTNYGPRVLRATSSPASILCTSSRILASPSTRLVE